MAALIIVGSEPVPLILGRSITEIMVRRLRAAGCTHIVLLVERVPAALLMLVDRLRREGATIDVTRSVTDAAERYHPEERVILVAIGRLLGEGPLAALTASTVPTLLCVENNASAASLELIDATARWTGFALLDGTILRRTAAMVGDWDFGSTLLRQMNAASAKRLPMAADDLIDASADNRAIGALLLTGRASDCDGVGDRMIVAPLTPHLARLAGEAGIGGRMLEMAGMMMAALALGGVLWGWLAAPLALFLTALVLIATGEVLEMATGGMMRHGRVIKLAPPLMGAAIALAAGRILWESSGQWGYLVLGIGIVAALALRQPTIARERRWLADPVGIAAIVLVGAVAGVSGQALAVATIFALGSLIWVNRAIWQKKPVNQA